jgi:hypothetical protein
MAKRTRRENHLTHTLLGSKERTMRSYLLGISAAVLGLAMVSTVEAGHGRSSGGSSSSHSMSSSYSSSRMSSVRSSQNYSNRLYNTSFKSTNFKKVDSHKLSSYNLKNYQFKYGKKFSFGWCYPNKYDCHWSYRCWCPYYRCWYYYDPCCSSYYYWCGSACCYYPISYIVTAPPVAEEVVTEVNEQVPEAATPAELKGPVVTSGPTK